MASIIYRKNPNGDTSWWIRFRNPANGADFGFSLATPDQNEAEKIRRRVELAVYLGWPALLAQSIPSPVFRELHKRKWIDAILGSEPGEL